MNSVGVGFPIEREIGHASGFRRRCSRVSAISHCLAQRAASSAGDFITRAGAAAGVSFELFPTQGGHGGPLAFAMNQNGGARMGAQEAELFVGSDEQGVQAEFAQGADDSARYGL